ncbi:aldehyde dehydrogenase [Bacterioplanes sanyensis]|uniref:Aldehyde dehydrogenase n=1 Tax=Bacterioplanes sanyensis TaxID=1249553 RepID=A0A222FEX2_9GAMM|nr:aldehyde dehydrogenase family protein [Bacterioplanes sanyensis]ASP37310.1 aldehyde dehydrogenase [Bacterioplanes sanyensis]
MTQTTAPSVAQHLTQPLPDQHFIDGQFVTSHSQEYLTSYDPGSGDVLGRFAAGNADDIEQAVQSSQQAFATWRHTAPAQRASILLKAAQLLRQREQLIATVECLDSGKTLSEARGDVQGSARLLEYYAGAADKLDGRSVPLGPEQMAWTVREPVGVTAHIIPWNYPTSTFIRGVAPALAAGCTVIAKPAETTPFTALLLAQLFSEAGLPAGVVNVVTGLGSDAGAPLVSHPGVQHVTFTGSVDTGVHVMQSAAPNITRLTLELGGKSPLIALDDCDLDAAAEGVRWAIFSNAGQICSAGSRLIVSRRIHQALLARVVELAQSIKLGHPMTNPDMGAINSELHLQRIEQHVEAARQRGCNIVCGGQITSDPVSGRGWFYQPTVVDQLSMDDPLVQQEVFGPVLAVQVVDSDEEALAAANATEFGLVSGVYSRDIQRALRLARDIDAGQVTINDYWAGGVELPFGGSRKSGFGKEKGWEGLDAYTKTKSIAVKL